jgi:hypothetical protein
MIKTGLHKCLKLIFPFLLLLGSGACFTIDYMTGEGEARRIRRVGERADAEIVDIWDTGITLNNNPVVGFKLLVRPENSGSYEARTEGLVSRLHIPRIQPGAVIQVAIDPEDRSRVALDIYKD